MEANVAMSGATKIERQYPGYYLWSAGKSEGYVLYNSESRHWLVVETKRGGFARVGQGAVYFDCRTLREAKDSILAWGDR